MSSHSTLFTNRMLCHTPLNQSRLATMFEAMAAGVGVVFGFGCGVVALALLLLLLALCLHIMLLMLLRLYSILPPRRRCTDQHLRLRLRRLVWMQCTSDDFCSDLLNCPVPSRCDMGICLSNVRYAVIQRPPVWTLINHWRKNAHSEDFRISVTEKPCTYYIYIYIMHK